MFYFAHVLKVKDHSINILIKALCMKCHPVNFKVKKIAIILSLFHNTSHWMTQEKVDLEFFYHRKYLFSLTNEACPKTMKACYLNCWTTSESLRKPIKTRSNEWFACNRIIVFARSSGIGTEQALQVVRKKCTARGCVVVQKNDFGEFLFEQ